jgi:hypothetical protein
LACAEFSWQGNDQGDSACGRAWLTLGTSGRLVGHFYIHKETTLASSPTATNFFNSLVGATNGATVGL